MKYLEQVVPRETTASLFAVSPQDKQCVRTNLAPPPPDATYRPLPRIGAQVSTAGGFFSVVRRALDLGAEAVQIFNANARTWRPKPYNPAEVTQLQHDLLAHDLSLYVHAIYLINLASPDKELQRKSAEALAQALFTAAACGAEGVVTHIGSTRGTGYEAGRCRVAETVQASLRLATDLADVHGITLPLPPLLLETGAGAGTTLGKNPAELEGLLEMLPDSCGLCLDTAHLFAAGQPVHTEEGLEAVVTELRHRGLLNRVALIHLNDSKTAFNQAKDRHENLGQGQLGLEALRRVVIHSAFQNVPFILEVPGQGHGPDAANVTVAKSLRR